RPLIKQSMVRKLRTNHSQSTVLTSSSADSSPNNSNNRRKLFYCTDDYPQHSLEDEGYASITTTTTTLGSQSVETPFLPSRSSSFTKQFQKNDSDTDDSDSFDDMIDWPSLNNHVQNLVDRLDSWLNEPLPERHIRVERPHVRNSYPVLQRTSTIPTIDLLSRSTTPKIPNQSNIIVSFVPRDNQVNKTINLTRSDSPSDMAKLKKINTTPLTEANNQPIQ
ncbi:unnamed protein product, partial [Didymodactylos carnosus]